MPSDKRHIKVSHDRQLYTTNVDNKKQQHTFFNFLFKCVTQPDLSGVHLTDERNKNKDIGIQRMSFVYSWPLLTVYYLRTTYIDENIKSQR